MTDVSSHIADFHNEQIEREKVLREAFAAAGVKLETEDDPSIRELASWAVIVPEYLVHQDSDSRKLLEVVRDTANDLRLAIAAVAERADEPGSGLNVRAVNICDYTSVPLLEETALLCLQLELHAESVLKIGRRPGRGQPPLLAYYAFVRRLHELYMERRQSPAGKGFYEKGGTGQGPFVDLVEAAQRILPVAMRLRERSTIGNRVLQAFTVSIPDIT